MMRYSGSWATEELVKSTLAQETKVLLLARDGGEEQRA